MPIDSSRKLENSPHIDRIFYLSEGRLARTLNGFVNNRRGCWIFHGGESGQIGNYYCGDAYQSKAMLKKTVERFANQLLGADGRRDLGPPMGLEYLDASDRTNEQKMGYEELQHELKQTIKQLEVSGQSKTSMCIYLYVWTEACKHCDEQSDMRVVKRAIEKRYRQWKQHEGLNMMYKLHSYDISHNLNIIYGVSDIAKINGLDPKQVTNSISVS
jgi:hypothetical protein